MPHLPREPIAARHPVLVTARLKPGLPNLRSRRATAVLARVFASATGRFGFRLVHFSVQSNHLHVIVEAANCHALSRGLRSLTIRAALGLNRTWGRKGPVFADRCHARVLRTPREVRNALAYVLNNARRHGIHLTGPDPFSSGRWFDGWREPVPLPSGGSLIGRPRTWLLAKGWRRHGLIGLDEVPGGSRRAREPRRRRAAPDAGNSEDPTATFGASTNMRRIKPGNRGALGPRARSPKASRPNPESG